MTRGKAIAFTGRDRIEFVDITIPERGQGEVLVESKLTAISQGTDRAMVAGTYRGVDDRYPFVYGYSRVGTVIEAGEDAGGLAFGDRVFVGMAGTRLDPADGLGEHGGSYTSHAVVHHSDVVRLPDGIDSTTAALGAIAAIAYQGVAATGMRPNSRVLVLGLGAVGQFGALFSRLRGAQVWAVDPIASRRDLCARISAATVLEPGDDLAQRIDATASGSRPWPGRNDRPAARYEQVRWAQADGVVDVVIDATGRSDAFSAYIPLIAREGCLCLQGYYAEPLVLDFHAAHMKRLAIRCPGGFDQADYETAVRLLALRDVTPLVGTTMRAADVPTALPELLAGGPTDVVCALVDWSEPGRTGAAA